MNHLLLLAFAAPAVLGGASLPAKPDDTTTPVQQRIAVSGPNGMSDMHPKKQKANGQVEDELTKL